MSKKNILIAFVITAHKCYKQIYVVCDCITLNIECSHFEMFSAKQIEISKVNNYSIFSFMD